MDALQFEPRSEHLLVRLAGAEPVPVADWTAREAAPPGIEVFLRLWSDGEAEYAEDGYALSVRWPRLAGLAPRELSYAGLPNAAPFTVEVRANGAIHHSDFQISYRFIRRGRHVWGVRRLGAWLSHGDDAEFILLEPLYSILDEIDAFTNAGESDIEARMLHWGRIRLRLPVESVVDDHLQSLHISVASSFRLHPFINQNGETDFHPILGRRVTEEREDDETHEVFREVLPSARQDEFARRFRGLPAVQPRYAVGGGAFVMLAKGMKRCLDVVHRAQRGTVEERRDLLKNVHGYLQAALASDPAVDAPSVTETESGPPDVVPEIESQDLDAIFSDEGLSDRVRGIGCWSIRDLPWIKMPGIPWLPPEELGVEIGGQVVWVPTEDLPCVIEQVKEAQAEGVESVEVNGAHLPVTPEVISTLEEYDRRARPARPDTSKTGPQGSRQRERRADQVLDVIDNLTETAYRQRRKPRGVDLSATGPALRSTLMPHQQEALRWLRDHWSGGSAGVLLADDMGLGKTIEALAFMSCLGQIMGEDRVLPHKPMLIVAPTGLLKNWLDEQEKHLSRPGLGKIVEAHGRELSKLRRRAAPMDKIRGELSDALPQLDLGELGRADCVLTTYETLRNYQHSFGRIEWRVAVFDEAQKIKNPAARITDAALAMNIDFCLLMTGTPVENRVADIWTLLDRAEPGLFGPLKEFSRRYESDEGSGQALEGLHSRLVEPKSNVPALMLRRLKEDHIDNLPRKVLHVEHVTMPARQAEVYTRVVSNRDGGKRILQTLHRLRSVSLHPTSPGDAKSWEEYRDGSARLSETFRILRRIQAAGEKALLFVEPRDMQAFLIRVLRREFGLSQDPLVINGAVSGVKRKQRVDEFQERQGFDVMILSPRAGGVGLTLTAANHVIHLTRWWNPAVEDQCTDRAYRIGQRRTVHVYVPIAVHPLFRDASFDVNLHNLIMRKRDLNRQVLAPTSATGDDFKELYRNSIEIGDNGGRRADAGGSEAARDIDIMEPEAFEDWVLHQLARAGYKTHRTPPTRDAGIDGLAVSPEKDHTLVIQCKHTQRTGSNRGPDAVEEVIRGSDAYRHLIKGRTVLMVVTNAMGFSKPSRRMAKAHDVVLIDRAGLRGLSSYRTS